MFIRAQYMYCKYIVDGVLIVLYKKCLLNQTICIANVS